MSLFKSAKPIGLVLFSLLLSVPALADFAKGKEAYTAGDYDTSFNELMARANQGDAYAQYTLGKAYMGGVGVLRNVYIAYHWFNLAYMNGIKDARKGRSRMCSKVRSDDDRHGSPGLDCLAIEYLDAHPAAYQAGPVKTILGDLCS